MCIFFNIHLILIIDDSSFIYYTCFCVSPPIKHQDDMKGEEDMAAKKAALLEKRLRREKEAQVKKQQQELDQEQKKEAARFVCLSYLLSVFLSTLATDEALFFYKSVKEEF